MKRKRLENRRITTSGRELPLNAPVQCLNLIFDQAPCHTTSRSKVSFNNAILDLIWAISVVFSWNQVIKLTSNQYLFLRKNYLKKNKFFLF